MVVIFGFISVGQRVDGRVVDERVVAVTPRELLQEEEEKKVVKSLSPSEHSNGWQHNCTLTKNVTSVILRTTRQYI